MLVETFSLPKDKKKILAKAKGGFLDDLSFQKQVFLILEKVRKEGDKAIHYFTKKFDKVNLNSLLISPQEINEAEVKSPLAQAIKIASRNIKQFHLQQRTSNLSFKGKYGEILSQTISPMEKTGVYVPGGKAGTTPLVSTLLMNVIPAQIAGVKEIIVVTPPRKDGSISPVILYALKHLGIQKAYKVGGAQAIAALSYGTKTIPRCDIIVGPGNAYVTYAKKLVFGSVMIDGLNGNSEIVILSDGSENPSYIAADLISQAEHAGEELVLLFTDQKEHAEAVKTSMEEQIKNAPRKKEIVNSLFRRGGIVVSKNWEETYEIVNQIAPEHLEIQLKNAKKALKEIKNAGTIFLGQYASEPIGDYICGTNHVLPTNQTARFSSPLGVYTFLKRTNIIEYNQKAFNAYKGHAITLAESEGLSAHANALKIRKN